MERSYEQPVETWEDLNIFLLRESLHFPLWIPARGMEKKEKNEAKKDIGRRKRTWRQGPRDVEGLAARMERGLNTKGPRQEALTELSDRLTGNLIREVCGWSPRFWPVWVLQEMRSSFRENQGLGLEMLNWTSRGRCVIESWMNSNLNQTRFGNRQKRGSDFSLETGWVDRSPWGIRVLRNTEWPWIG